MKGQVQRTFFIPSNQVIFGRKLLPELGHLCPVSFHYLMYSVRGTSDQFKTHRCTVPVLKDIKRKSECIDYTQTVSAPFIQHFPCGLQHLDLLLNKMLWLFLSLNQLITKASSLFLFFFFFLPDSVQIISS